MPEGLICFHIEGYKVSRHDAVQACLRLGGKFALVVNDAELCADLVKVGVTPIFRVKQNEIDWDDDNAHEHFNTEAYLRMEHEKLLAAGDEGKSYLHWNNEPSTNRLDIFKRELAVAIRVANQLGRKLVAGSIAYRQWQMQDFDYIAEELALMVLGGHIWGVHEGYSWELTTIDTARGESIGRIIPAMEKYGFRVIVTEFAASWKPDYGWQAFVREVYNAGWEQYRDLIVDALRLYGRRMIGANQNISLCLFTLGEWGHGFSHLNFPDLIDALNALNQIYVYKETPQMPTPEEIELIPYIMPTNGRIHHMSSGEVMQFLYDAEGYGALHKNGAIEEMWVEVIDGERWIMRGLDTSQFPPASGGTVYALYRDQQLKQYGAKWSPVKVKIGQIIKRDNVFVQVFNAATGAKIAQGSGWDTTYFRVKAHHPIWTTPEGVQVQDVIECQYSHDPKMATVNESYFYGRDLSLVGYIDPRMKVFITRENPTSVPAPYTLSWWKRPPLPALPVPGDNYPPGSNPATMMIAFTDGLNLRKAPYVTAGRIRAVAHNEVVTVFAEPVVAATYMGKTLNWVRVRLQSGESGWAAREVDGVASFKPVAANAPLVLKSPVGCDYVITSRFGVPRDYDGDGSLDDKHEGLDLAPAHKNCHPLILAAVEGTVVKVSTTGAYGNHVLVDTERGTAKYTLWYCHMEKFFVAVGDKLKVGDYIGVMGSTGNSTGTHLHLNVQQQGLNTPGYVLNGVVDPLPLLQP